MLAVFLQLGFKRFARRVIFPQHDERLDDGASHRVRLSHHSGLQHRGVFDQRAFHFERADAIAGAFDHIVGSSNEPVVALVVPPDQVARQIPIAPKTGRVLGRVKPVFAEQAEWTARFEAHRQFPFLAG